MEYSFAFYKFAGKASNKTGSILSLNAKSRRTTPVQQPFLCHYAFRSRRFLFRNMLIEAKAQRQTTAPEPPYTGKPKKMKQTRKRKPAPLPLPRNPAS